MWEPKLPFLSAYNALLYLSLCEKQRLQGLSVTQILTCPHGFEATTILMHYGDGSLTGDMKHNDSIRLSSFCTLLRSGSGTFLAVWRENGLASSFNLTPLQGFLVLVTDEGKASWLHQHCYKLNWFLKWDWEMWLIFKISQSVNNHETQCHSS